jgi:hypothetical protein
MRVHRLRRPVLVVRGAPPGALARGGPTSLENSGLLCGRHHTQVHAGYRVERAPDGSWRTWRPDGTEILLLPPIAATPDLARAG